MCIETGKGMIAKISPTISVVILFLLFVLLFMQIILNKILPSFTEYYRYILLLLIIIGCIDGLFLCNFRISKINIYLVWFFCLALVYLGTIGAIRGLNYFHYWLKLRGFLNFLPLVLLIDVYRKHINKIDLFKFSIWFLFAESMLGFAQYFRIEFIYKFIDLKPAKNLFFDNSYTGVFLPHGTFERYNVYGNVLSLVVVYVLGKYLLGNCKIKINKYFFWMVVINSLALIFLCGNRMSLISFVCGSFCILIKKYKIKFILVSTLLIFVLISVWNLELSRTRFSSKISDNPISRYETLLSIPENSLGSGLSTVVLNLQMLQFVFKNILFGVGKYYTNSSYGIINQTSANYTDVLLLWLVSEIGIFGLICFVSPYIVLLVASYKQGDLLSFVTHFACFVTLFVQTISDMGLFLPEASFLILLFISTDLFENKKSFKASMPSYCSLI